MELKIGTKLEVVETDKNDCTGCVFQNKYGFCQYPKFRCTPNSRKDGKLTILKLIE